MGNKSRLNIFQRGSIQHLLTCLVYLACLGGMALIVDAFEKRRFASIAEQAAAQNIIPASALERLRVLSTTRTVASSSWSFC